MITAIDFGCHTIRSAFRCPDDPQTVSLFCERAEYAVLPNSVAHIQALADNLISYATCEDSLVVFGNRASEVRWLSRQPCAPLFTDGQVPREDAPARQILNVLTQALLPLPHPQSESYCVFTSPAGKSQADNNEFLSRLIRMQGWMPVACNAGDAATLATGHETRFTGISIVMGAESTQLSVSRLGKILTSETIEVGANWIDAELATSFSMKTWDEMGDCYLDLDGVRNWKHDSRIQLGGGVDERERTLERLYGVVLNRIARSVHELMNSGSVRSVLGDERLAIVCAGGATEVAGFAGALTERFVEHDIASEILSVRVADDPSTTVIRGLLIQGELDQLSASRAA